METPGLSHLRHRKFSPVQLGKILKGLREAHNDLRVVAGSSVDSTGFTLVALLRDEMYFLPDFLNHYRRLGVKRFVLLNDQSKDGSLEFLVGQPDVVVVESEHGRTFGDRIAVPPEIDWFVQDFRIEHVWRALLFDMFATDCWSLHVDLDEFVWLPDGVTFPDIIADLDAKSGKRGAPRMVWGVMLDAYPRDIASLGKQEAQGRLDRTATWYFDGLEHIRIRPDKFPRVLYAGARARLYKTYGVNKVYPDPSLMKESVWTRLRKTRLGLRPRRGISQRKVVLLKWDQSSYLRSPHRTDLPASDGILLPIQHFRFCGALYHRLRFALRERCHYNNSMDYLMLQELLRSMEARDGSFLYRKSIPLNSFQDFLKTRNAAGL